MGNQDGYDVNMKMCTAVSLWDSGPVFILWGFKKDAAIGEAVWGKCSLRSNLKTSVGLAKKFIQVFP